MSLQQAFPGMCMRVLDCVNVSVCVRERESVRVCVFMLGACACV